MWLVAVIVSFVGIGTLWLKVVSEKMLLNGYMKPQCVDDGFMTVTYYNGDRYRNQIKKHLKIFAIDTGEAGAYSMSFNQAVVMCNNLNATMWEVDNEAEWVAITKALKSSVGSIGVWLNGKVKGGECDSGKECKKTEALQGQGVSIRWKSDKRIGQYSRLYKGETLNEKCVYVEDNTDALWNVDNCTVSEHVLV
jgi:hypothetical protein